MNHLLTYLSHLGDRNTVTADVTKLSD